LYKERLEILKDWKEYVNKITKAAKDLLQSCEVYAFGSAVSSGLTAASDIDVLIVTENLPNTLMKRAKVKEEIEQLANLPPHHPIQIHLVTRKEAKQSSIYSKVSSNRPHSI
jgi:predicted nucleotidyltransferase